jgi:hypothetical protein
MPTRFMIEALAALNELTELTDCDLSSTKAASNGSVGQVAAHAASPQGSDIRFAAIVGSCMAKIRSGMPGD